MKAYCITLRGSAYSETCADRCIRTGVEYGTTVERFNAVPAGEAERVRQDYGLRWTWTTDGVRYCPHTGLRQHPYGGGEARLGCAMSHYLLWRCCAESGPILILEHDAVFLRELPDFSFAGACQVNDPAGATPRGRWWSDHMAKRGAGVYPKTLVRCEDERIPDGLAGNSAYVLQPHAADHLIGLYHELGVWPNDATMCRQLCPWLEELYPFVTRVEQTVSTTSG